MTGGPPKLAEAVGSNTTGAVGGLRALLFDLDGTLADTAAANIRAYTLALSECGVAVPAGELAIVSLGRNWRQFLPPLLERSGSTAAAAHVADRKKAIYGAMAGDIRINDPLVALARSARGRLKTALVTTASGVNAGAILDAHGLRSCFDIVVTGDDVAQHKPHPQAYLLALERLGIDASQAIAFEDSDIGMASARAAGIGSVRVVFPSG